MDLKESSVDDEALCEVEVGVEGSAAEFENVSGVQHDGEVGSRAAPDNHEIESVAIDENSCELVELGDDFEMKMKIKEMESAPPSHELAKSELPPRKDSGSDVTAQSVVSPKPRAKAKDTAVTPLPKELQEPKIELRLPCDFHLKYLGKRDAGGIWGIKYTRRPVDMMVEAARQRSKITPLPFLKLTVSVDGIQISDGPGNDSKDFPKGLLPIHVISYGVQDLVYTRVFAMIVVSESNNVREKHPFQCLAFVSDSHQTARRLTYALAEAFKLFSTTVKAEELRKVQKRFAIDLREPEECQEAVDDSEV